MSKNEGFELEGIKFYIPKVKDSVLDVLKLQLKLSEERIIDAIEMMKHHREQYDKAEQMLKDANKLKKECEYLIKMGKEHGG